MNLLENWVQTPAAKALVWTLIHSLWEGALVALVLAAALCVLPRVARPLRRRLPRAGRPAGRLRRDLRQPDGARTGRSSARSGAPPACAAVDLEAGASSGMRAARSAAGLSAVARSVLDRRRPAVPPAQPGRLDRRAAPAPHAESAARPQPGRSGSTGWRRACGSPRR